jgi:hypothetical protein
MAVAAAGNYTATFVAGSNAGNANVQVDALDAGGNILSSASTLLALSSSAANAASITLQAGLSSMPPSIGNTKSTTTLTAMVRDATNNPVGNAAVLFELVNPTGSGEQISPVTVMTSATGATGQALSTFTAGPLPTTQMSQIRASVIGTVTPVQATTTITVGGTATSIAISPSTTISSINTNTTYQLPVSILVTDSLGNAVSNAQVSLSLWPKQYRKGNRSGATCSITPSTSAGPPATSAVWLNNEDVNENAFLDAGEDVDGPGGSLTVAPYRGVPDGILWPPQASGGSVPASVMTGVDGTATFNWTYLKQYADWVAVRLRAKTGVQGSESTSEVVLTLTGSAADEVISPCPLPSSPFN